MALTRMAWPDLTLCFSGSVDRTQVFTLNPRQNTILFSYTPNSLRGSVPGVRRQKTWVLVPEFGFPTVLQI